VRKALTKLASDAGLSADQQVKVAAAKAADKDFMSVDATVATDYKGGSAAKICEANKLVLTTEIVNYTKIADAVASLSTNLDAQAAADVAVASDQASRSKLVMLIGVLLGLLVVGFIVLVMIRSITAPLESLRERIADIADGEGDLRARIPEDGKDELTMGAGLVNTFIGQIAEVIEKVGGSAQIVAAAAEQLGAAITEISRNTSQAASMAERGREVIGTANDTVRQRGESSMQIGDVLTVISTIAQQTNLLALNATIEAARAGEGFAVRGHQPPCRCHPERHPQCRELHGADRDDQRDASQRRCRRRGVDRHRERPQRCLRGVSRASAGSSGSS